jgi:DNA-binding NtrC family response regulator
MKTQTEKILVVDGDTDYTCRLSKLLLSHFQHKKNKLEILIAKNEEEARMQLKEISDIKLVLLDDSREYYDFNHIFNHITKDLKIQILIISCQAENISEQKTVNKWDQDSIKTSIDIKLSNYDKITKTSLRQDVEYLMGKGKVISAVFDQVEKYAKIDKPVLIEGETGTGKEIIVNYLSKLSARDKIINVNCGSFSKDLAASELFGSVKGAFTDAQNKKGFVEEAEGGILFLDEFNSLPLDVQVIIYN